VKQAYEKDSFVDRQTSELNIENLKKTFKEQVERHRTSTSTDMPKEDP